MASTTIDTFTVFSDHYQPVNPLGGSAVVKVIGGDTIYYADQPYVTSSTNQGSVALNASHTFTRPAWLLSLTTSSVSVTITGVVDDDVTAVATAEAASVLRDGTGLPSDVPKGAADTLVDAKGDLLAGTANDVRARLAVGTDRQVLTADAASTPGVKWVTPLSRLLQVPVAGTATVAAGVLRFRFPAAVTIESAAITANTAPTGAAILVDVNKNGTTIFSTQNNRPTIAISGFASTDAVPDVTAFAAGDYLTVDVDQVGSTIAGADLVATVKYR